MQQCVVVARTVITLRSEAMKNPLILALGDRLVDAGFTPLIIRDAEEAKAFNDCSGVVLYNATSSRVRNFSPRSSEDVSIPGCLRSEATARYFIAIGPCLLLENAVQQILVWLSPERIAQQREREEMPWGRLPKPTKGNSSGYFYTTGYGYRGNSFARLDRADLPPLGHIA